ncbi:MAG TPA: GSCFA domain-containing protein [Alphaproteobacteria bacterium]
MLALAELLNAAMTEHKAARLDGAAALYQSVLDREPRHADALHLLGVVCQQRGDGGRAEALIRAAIGESPQAPIMHNNLGQVLAARGDWAAAADCYREAIRRAPDYADAFNNLGIALDRAGSLDQAEANYRRALELRPEYRDALSNLGIVLRKKGALVDAIDCFRRALDLDPGYAPAANNLGAALKAQGQIDAAIAQFRRALELQPGLTEAGLNLAQILWEQGRLREAESGYRQVIGVDPHHFDAHQQLAILLTNLGRHDEGLRLRESYLRSHPDVIDFPLGYVVARGEFGDPLSIEMKTAWHVGRDIRYFPLRFRADAPLAELVEQFLLRDVARHRPVFAADAKLVTFGSCFADHLRREFLRRGRMSEHVDVPQGLNNSFALRDFFEWALTGKRDTAAYWYNHADERRAVRWEPQAEQAMFANALKSADGFVITFGLAEIWRDRATGGVFWRGVPAGVFDPARHELVMSSVEDNARNMRAIYDLIRAGCGPVPIVMTLSPVPLNATFGADSSCLEADCVSKSTLRVALDMLMRNDLPGLHYWPAFEIVRWLGAQLGRPMFQGQAADPGPGARFDDTRHVAPDVVACIIETFIGKFFAAAPIRERRPA